MASDDWRKQISAANTAFFLDVDGTLLDFELRPEDVLADPGLLSLLDHLCASLGGALALVSGRTIADLDRIVSPLRLPAAGTHGAELRFAGGRQENTENEGGALDDVRKAARAFVAERCKLRLEDKGASLAIHYRKAPELATEVAAFLERVVVQNDIMIQHGKMVAEVKSTRSHKGIAIEVLMQSVPFTGRMPVFIGDDLTDEYGFAAVNELGGISIKVGEGRTVAQYRFAHVQDVHAFLRQILASNANETSH